MVKKKGPIEYSENHKTVYCDHLVRFGFGPVVSKLDFGIINDIDSGDERVSIQTTIIIPTPNLIDVIPLLHDQSKNPEVRNDIISKLSEIISSLEEENHGD
ncbi:TPA: hypothetical protein QCK30_004981 [Enterobacter sichuanensis]|uniref:hypothetical protein n=1 Tax=Enterobacteriaceae TaxID=543 RepID=UPI0011584863|nr:hypothetical protein [Klebsiella pneumoniae]HDR2846419.1 hypothetical protein [Enterobacter sichuanensis]